MVALRHCLRVVLHNGNMSASQTIRQSRPIVFSVLVLLLGPTACMLDPNADSHSQHPDQVLFNRAMFAMQQNRLDVERITLQTLVNTYPNSEYASKADQALGDSRLESATQEMEFFPAPDDEQPSPHP